MTKNSTPAVHAHEHKGLQLLAQGQWAAGIGELRQAIALGGMRAALAFNLANALTHQGRPAEALEVLDSALSHCEPSADLFYAQGLARQAQSDSDGAMQSYRACLSLSPGFAAAHNNLGTLLELGGDREAAIASFQRALASQPAYVRALTNLGNALRRAGRFEEAGEALKRALTLNPNHAPALCNFANVLVDSGHLNAARAMFERCTDLAPTLVEGFLGLGRVQGLLGESVAALSSLDSAARLAPALADVHFQCGRILDGTNQLEAALTAYRRATQIDAGFAEAWNCSGMVLCRLGIHGEALDAFRRALACRPDYPSARWNLGLLELTLGNFRSGWPLFEARLEMPPAGGTFPKSSTAWRGDRAIAGKTLLIQAEYGLGDTLQFCRFIKRIESLGARILFEVPAALRRLLSSLGTTAELVVRANDRPITADFHCPLLSMPLALGCDLESIPGESGYLKADPANVGAWAGRLPRARGLRIGIAWRGNPAAEVGVLTGRSIPLTHFARLVEVPDVEIVVLQKGPGTEECYEVSFRDRIVDIGAMLDSGPDAFWDTAAIMMNLDLVVSCDTAIAHLAGALGVPVWVALNATPDWRWLLGRDDSPWYPTMRLFRQPAPGDWNSVFKHLRDALACGELSRTPHPNIGRVLASAGVIKPSPCPPKL